MLLAVDTSTRQMGLALYDGDMVIGELLWHSQHYHTVELAPAVDNLLSRSGIGMDAVRALGVALGPWGSAIGAIVGGILGAALAKKMVGDVDLSALESPDLDAMLDTE